MHSFLKHQAPKSPTRFHEEPEYGGGDIRLSQRAIPAMLTLDPNAVRLDCLGYLMHRIRRDGVRITE